MSAEIINNLVREEKKHLKKYKQYIQTNNWSFLVWNQKGKPKLDTDIRKEEFNLHNNIINTILTRLKVAAKKSEGSHHLKSFKDYVGEIKKLLELHKQRAEEYLLSSDVLEKSKDDESSELRSNEIDFHRHLHQTTAKVLEDFNSMNLKLDDERAADGIEFYDNVKAPLSMHNVLVELYPQIQRTLDEMGIDFTSPPKNEMLINIPNPPKWNTDKHYFHQEKETLQFYVDEFKKLKNGINIDGVYISGWAYYHINVFVTPIPHKVWNPLKSDYDSEDKIINPPLRDSDWMLFENRALQESTKTLFMFVAATRRAAKTTAEASMLGHAATVGKKELLCAGSNAKDLGQLAKNFKTDTLYKNPAFAIYNVANDWSKKIEIGIKTKTQKTIPLSTLHIINTDDGNNKEIFAGYTPDLVVIDEAMKSKFLEALEGLIPAMQGSDGMIRAFGMLSGTGGCLTENNKVFNRYGELVSIKEITKEQGIVGYNGKSFCVEEIPYIQEPTYKECIRIETNSGRFLECTLDHPILKKISIQPKGNKNEFVEAKDFKIGDYLATIDEVDIWGEEEVDIAREIGWLIGDGSYGNKQSVRMHNCEYEINEYLFDKYNCTIDKSYITKEGKNFYSFSILEYTKKLRDLGIYGQTKGDKKIPEIFNKATKKSVCELLGGLFDTDGYVSYRKNNARKDSFICDISISQAHIEILRHIQLLLQKLGIHSKIRVRKPRLNNPIDRNDWYELHIRDAVSLVRFYENISFFVKFKQENLNKIYVYSKKINRTTHKGIRYEKVTKIENIGFQKIYNLEAGQSHTYLGNGIITHNTEKLSEDGYKSLSDPATYDILPMQWQILERGVDEKFITWKEDKKRPFGTFIPGQCRVDMPKIKGNLADYLGVDSPTLRKININITDWEKSAEIIKEKRKKVEKDRLKHQKEVVYCPTKPSEIFMSGALNPFPVEELKRRREELLEKGDVGKKVTLIQDNTGKISYELSNKELAGYPHPGGFIDAPIVLYEELPEVTPPTHLYVAGFDDYKQDESDTDSVGSFHIYKVNIGMDEWCGRIVASLATRPDPHGKLHRQIFLLQQAFNAKCFMENADDKYKQYLETKRVADLWLYESIDFKGDITQKATNKRRYGWTPTPQNIRFLKNLVINYTKEEFTILNEDGDEITVLGAQRINDLTLIQEMIDYRESANVDRMTSFMSCLGIEYYLYTNWLLPKPDWEKQRKSQEKIKPKTEKNLAQRMYGGSVGKRRIF
jgi:hypothetical protein